MNNSTDLHTLAVQSTNDSSIASKLSMCEHGYFDDPFIKYFMSRPVRRSPLINRGYYIRSKAVSTVVISFVEEHHSGAQIVSLGAGFDTTYFRLHSERKLSSCKYFEVDYPEVIGRKADAVKNIPQYRSLLRREQIQDSEMIYIENYIAFGCDITDIQKLKQLLCASGIDPNRPTLLIAECVLSYIEPIRVDCLLRWCATYFQNAVFCAYEQINPDDKFGQVMIQHFISRNSSLKGLSIYSDQRGQKERYSKAGWEKTLCCDMNDFYMSLPCLERCRVEDLELFDEFEEWHLKCSHYAILCGAVGQCVTFLNSLNFPESVRHFDAKVNNLSISLRAPVVGRYSHCSVQKPSGEVIIHGGFGCLPDSGMHSRLDSMIGLNVCESGFKIHNIKLCNDQDSTIGCLVHHKAVLLPTGDTLIFGGRTAPKKSSGTFYLCSQSEADKMVVKKLQLSSSIPGRWRHTMTLITINEVYYAVIIGGCSDMCNALSDCCVLNINEESLNIVSTLPCGLHSHCTILFNDGLLIIGGLNSSMIPQSSTLYLHPCEMEGTIEWKLSSVTFTPQLPARYGAAGVVQGNIAWLIGGVSMFQGCEILMLDLVNKTWKGYNLSLPVSKEHPLLINCTAHLHKEKELLIIGGGGNLFSFGTCINYLATIVSTD